MPSATSLLSKLAAVAALHAPVIVPGPVIGVLSDASGNLVIDGSGNLFGLVQQPFVSFVQDNTGAIVFTEGGFPLGAVTPQTIFLQDTTGNLLTDTTGNVLAVE